MRTLVLFEAAARDLDVQGSRWSRTSAATPLATAGPSCLAHQTTTTSWGSTCRCSPQRFARSLVSQGSGAAGSSRLPCWLRCSSCRPHAVLGLHGCFAGCAWPAGLRRPPCPGRAGHCQTYSNRSALQIIDVAPPAGHPCNVQELYPQFYRCKIRKKNRCFPDEQPRGQSMSAQHPDHPPGWSRLSVSTPRLGMRNPMAAGRAWPACQTSRCDTWRAAS